MKRPIRLLLVCYDPVELETLRARMQIEDECEVPGSRFPLISGTLDGVATAVMRIPFGDDPVLLRRVVGALLATVQPAVVVSLGTAMACHEGLELGDVVLLRSASQEGRRVEFGDWILPDLLHAAPRELRVRPGHGITSRTFVGDPTTRDALLAGNPGADVIEMEDFHVASLAAEYCAEYASIHAVTDRGDFAEHMAHRQPAAQAVVRLLRRSLRSRRSRRGMAVMHNPPTSDLPWKVVVRRPEGPLTIPEAVRRTRQALAAFGLRPGLPEGTRLDLTLTAAAPAPPSAPNRPSGQAKRAEASGDWAAVQDPVSHHTCLSVRESLLDSYASSDAGGPRVELIPSLRAAEVELVGAPDAPPATYPALPEGALHLQGLNSISAEPEEGLMVATTICEFTDIGVKVRPSHEAAVWVYRSANASPESYFEPAYALPARTDAEVPAGVYKVATGLGPAIDPEAAGGRDADMLVLGDEQGGRLVQIIDDLGGHPLTAEDALRYDGVAMRLDHHTVALARLDRRPVVTSRGLNALRFDPVVLRGIYGQEYDAFLRDYFSGGRRSREAKASHLLMTSRGCGYQCSFCCSGGMQPFAALAVDVLVPMLREVHDAAAPRPGEHVDVFLLDSYFNMDAERICELAARLDEEDLLAGLQLFVRHNGLLPFVRRRATPEEGPRVHTGLVQAFKTLGIHEVVVGVDAYTESSIRALKTGFEQLVKKGAQARPLYTFPDILAVVAALEAEQMDTRAFLLAYDPFASDADRVQTFYNLLTLAEAAPGFVVDVGSSEGVNVLKPFPGAPLTVLAEEIPGLVQGDAFVYQPPAGFLEDFFDLEMFGSRRRDPASAATFSARSRSARRALLDHLRMARESLEDRPPSERSELAAAMVTLAREEARRAESEGEHTRDLAAHAAELGSTAAPFAEAGPWGHEKLFAAIAGSRFAAGPAAEAPRPVRPRRLAV